MHRADEDEYRQFVLPRLEPLRRMAFLLCRDWHTADDLVSITVGKLYRRWHRAREAQNLDAYVRGILTHAWLDERRRPWRREYATPVVPDATVPAGEPPDAAMLRRLLDPVPWRQRAVIVLRFYCDLSVAQTASILGISEGAVKSQSARGLEVLRQSMTSPLGEEK
jgi:RNA polymerase sigma-70 factor (sigma-E family)